jgi:hypothetical protein
VSTECIRRRLGHASTGTTRIYTLLADKITRGRFDLKKVITGYTGRRRPHRRASDRSLPSCTDIRRVHRGGSDEYNPGRLGAWVPRTVHFTRSGTDIEC